MTLGINRIKTSYNIYPHILGLIEEEPFYAEISRRISKVATDSIVTCAIVWDPKTEDLMFAYNPQFMQSLSNIHTRYVLIHEFMHIVFGHLDAESREKDKQTWNIATDLAINSLIYDIATRQSQKDPLPSFCFTPGRDRTSFDGKPFSAEEAKINLFIKNLPPLMSSDVYYWKLQEIMPPKKGNGDGDGEGGATGTLDDHSFWDQIPADKRDIFKTKVRDIIEKAVKQCDGSNSWGNMPQDLQRDIRRSVTTIIDWKGVLRNFAGTLIRGKKKSSIKKINKRYPYIHAGRTVGRVAKLLVAVDQSGSVSDEMLEELFAELRGLNKNVEIDYLPFDCTADEADIKTWNRGKAPTARRSKMGGTDFDAPTRVINDPNNRGRWDGLLIFTDGCAPAPCASRVKRGWVLGRGCKMYFDTSEIVIKVDDPPLRGQAWR